MAENLIELLKSDQNVYLIPPYLDKNQAHQVQKVWESLNLTEHVFICSSGTSSGSKIKSYALSKEALKANAKAVNKFLNASSADKWLQSLPCYHVGGLSIIFRCLLSKSARIEFTSKWNTRSFLDILHMEKIQYCSVVPTQLYDLVSSQSVAPEYLKGVFVGGDFLSDELAKRAFKLGWPIIRTYGMTEVCSQLATSFYQDSKDGMMRILPIHQIHTVNQCYFVKSPSLFTYEIIMDGDDIEILSPTIDGYKIQDKLIMEKDKLKPLGRIGSEIKIKGRLYNFLDIKNSIDSFLIDNNFKNKVELVLENDQRDGKVLKLIALSEVKEYADAILDGINDILPKPLRQKKMIFVSSFRRTALGKLKI